MKSKSIDPYSRGLLASVLGWFFLGISPLSAQTLREGAANFPGLQVGAAIKSTSLTGGNAAYANTIRRDFNSPSPENDTK